MIKRAIGLFAIVAAATAAAGDVFAGQAEPWQINFQAAASPVMERVHQFHHLLLVVMAGIVLLVLGLLAYIIVRFNARSNPVPSKTAHNTVLEVIWTAVPIAILVIIAIPSMRLLYFADRAVNAEMTLKVVGHQWYWSYEYPDHGGFAFDSIPVPTEELKPGQPRLLAVDNPVVLPVDTPIKVLIASQDVIHNWAVPALGLKKDATPGRVNETWVQITKEGTYYGMCSELCGVNHYYMPVQIVALSKDKFAQWAEEAKKQFAGHSQPSSYHAAADRQ